MHTAVIDVICDEKFIWILGSFCRSYFIDTSNFVDPFVICRSSFPHSFFFLSERFDRGLFLGRKVEEFPIENLSYYRQVNLLVDFLVVKRSSFFGSLTHKIVGVTAIIIILTNFASPLIQYMIGLDNIFFLFPSTIRHWEVWQIWGYQNLSCFDWRMQDTRNR